MTRLRFVLVAAFAVATAAALAQTSGFYEYPNGPVRILPGTAAVPGLSFIGDEDTGIYRTAANSFGVAVNGANALTVTSSAITGANQSLTGVVLGAGSTTTAGTGTGTSTVGGVIRLDATAVGNVGGGTDTLITYNLPANTLSATNKAVRLTFWGTGANVANAKTLVCYFGTQSLFGSVSLTNGDADTWRGEAIVVRTAAAAEEVITRFYDDTGTDVNTATHAEPTEDLTTAVTIKCTGAATTTDDIVQEGLLVETLN